MMRRVETYEEFFAAPVEEGAYWKVTQDGVVCWHVRIPGCEGHGFLGPQPQGAGHEVDEHEDGTITVEAKPENSNSILLHPCGCHGYIDRGVWRPC